jgi:hypothetical protein
MIFTPQIEGAAPVRSAAAQFFEAFRQRVRAGLLTGQPHPRSNYEVNRTEPGHLAIRAADWWTAINVGLNQIDLELRPGGSVHYRVRYWRWARYVIAWSGTLAGIGIALLLSFDVRGYIARHPSSMLPGFSVDQNLRVAWFMVLFWGFVWPWLLIVLHKRPLRRLIVRLITEVDARATVGTDNH